MSEQYIHEDLLGTVAATIWWGINPPPSPIPPNAMRVGPGTDAVVWKVCPDGGVEL